MIDVCILPISIKHSYTTNLFPTSQVVDELHFSSSLSIFWRTETFWQISLTMIQTRNKRMLLSGVTFMEKIVVY